jgi:putative flippase GtrA
LWKSTAGKSEQKKQVMRRFLKFGALSGAGWLLDSGILLVLSQGFEVPLSIANFLSSSIAAIVVFTASRFFVFDAARAQPLLKTLIYFCYTCGIIVVASIAIGPVLWMIEYSSRYAEVQLTAAQAAFLAKVVITPPQLLANFMMSRYLSEAKIGNSGD